MASITWRDITWTYTGGGASGVYATGEKWVVGPIVLTGVSTSVSGCHIGGGMVNPNAGDMNTYSSPDGNVLVQGFDSRRGTYSSVLKFISGEIITGSLITSVSWDNKPGDRYIHHFGILTVVENAPVSGATSFRPAYGDATNKDVVWTTEDINTDLLQSHVPSGTPNISGLFDYPWIDLFGCVSGEMYDTSDYGMPKYGVLYLDAVAEAGLYCNCNYSAALKLPILVGLIQAGIDNAANIANGAINLWPNNGGQGQGRKFPILFAGLLLNDATMLAIADKSGDYIYNGDNYEGLENMPADYINFAEDDQTFYVDARDVAREWPAYNANDTNNTHPDNRNYVDPGWTHYVNGQLGMAEWGVRHATEPACENSEWNIAYRNTVGKSISGFTLAALMTTGMKSAWKHNVLFDYADRFVPCETQAVAEDPNADSSQIFYGNRGDFQRKMYNAYRKYYSPIWTRSDTTDKLSNGYYAGGTFPYNLLFNNTSFSATVAADAIFDLSGSFTFMFYAKTGSTIGFFSLFNINPTQGMALSGDIVTKIPWVSVSDGTDTVTVNLNNPSASPLEANKWYSFVVRVDRVTNLVKLFVRDIAAGTTASNTGDITAVGDITSTGNLIFQSLVSETTLLSDIRFYQKALSDTDVARIMTGTSKGTVVEFGASPGMAVSGWFCPCTDLVSTGVKIVKSGSVYTITNLNMTLD